MDVTLINTPYLDIYEEMRSAAGIYFPLGLGYIAAVLKKNGYRVNLVDLDGQRRTYQSFIEELRRVSPKVVGISCTTPTYSNAKRIAAEVKKNSDALVLIGGPHASAVPETILNDCPDIDIAVIGEGEQTALEICQVFNSGKKELLSQVKGIACRENGSIQRTKPRPFITELDNLPYPARELADMTKYRPQPFLARGNRTATIYTSRGCPYQCIFCASFTTMGSRYRVRSPADVVAEIKYLVDNYGIDYVLIKDDTFTIQPERVKQICRLIKQEGLKIEWHSMVRANTADYQMLKMMKEAGCSNVLIGVESGDEKILKTIKKGITTQDSRKAIQRCRDLGIDVTATFVLGIPGESRESIKRTVDFAIELDPLFVTFFTLVPYPGSEVYKRYAGSLLTLSPDWNDYVASASRTAIDLQGISGRQLQGLATQSYLRFYLRPRQIVKVLTRIKTFPMFKALFRAGISLLKKTLRFKEELSMKKVLDNRGEEKENWDIFWKKRKKTLIGRMLFFIRIKFITKKFVQIAKRYSRKGKVLEAGCGSALSSILLSKERGDQIVALDISELALLLAKNLAREENVAIEAVRGDIRKLPFLDKYFDLAWNIGTIEHFRDPQNILQQMRRVSKTTICVVPLKSFAWYAFERLMSFFRQDVRGYFKLYTEKELKELFARNRYTEIITERIRALYVFSYLAIIGQAVD